MKIIDNKKDYYDYLSGIYGIDEHVVFDRRGSVSGKELLSKFKSYWEPIFNPSILTENGSQLVSHFNGFLETGLKYKIYHITVEAGDKHWYILCTRKWEDKSTYTKNDKAEITFELYDPDCVKNHLMFKHAWWRRLWDKEKADRAKKFSDCSVSIRIDETYGKHCNTVDNPILSDIPGIKSLISAEDIWNSVYDYLLKMKNPKIVDNRTDIEHLESAGFDKKTSFRKM